MARTRSIPRNGFTLIELMIVVAIIGILAAVAMPAYQDNVVRSRLTELVLYSSKCKNVIEETSQVRLTAVRTGNDWGCAETAGPVLSQYVHSVVTSAAGVISVQAHSIRPVDVDGQSIVLTPYADTALSTAMTATDYLPTAGTYIRGWRCSFTGSPRYTPSSCR